jgi:hypothetical protein
MENKIFKDLKKGWLIILVYIVSLGLGSLLITLLTNLEAITTTPYEQINLSIQMFYLVLLWLSLAFILKDSVIFLIFNTPLYFGLFLRTNIYYPYVTLLFVITLTFSILLRNIGGKFAFLPRLKSWVSSERFL